MRRREVIAGLGAALAMPASAQVRPSTHRIGYIHAITLSPSNSTMRVMRPLWTRLGFVEGETVLLRTANGDASRLPGIVTDLISRQVSVIIAVGAETVRAAAAGTRTVPIVAIDLETNPVRSGLAETYARPGGNVTGVFLDQPSMAAKWIELLREAAPTIQQVGFIWDRSTGTDQLDVAHARAAEHGLRTAVIEWRNQENLEAALAPFRGGRTGLITLTSPGMSTIVDLLNRSVATLKIPSLIFLRTYLLGGLLASYGPDQDAHFTRAMVLVERILAGERPGDLPIELPARYELVIDQRAANVIQLTIPPTLLARADEVIE